MAKPHDTMVSVSNKVADLTARKPHGWYYSMPAVDVQGGNVNRSATCAALFLRTIKLYIVMEENEVQATQGTQGTQVEQAQPLPIVVILTPSRPYEKSIYFKVKPFSKGTASGVVTYSTTDGNEDVPKSITCLIAMLYANANVSELYPLIAAELQARSWILASEVSAKLAPLFNGTIAQLKKVVLSVGDVNPNTLKPVTEETKYYEVEKAKMPNVPLMYIERALKYIESMPTTPPKKEAVVTSADVTDPFVNM